uniref:Uncharacterized protein n=1 Tax=Tetranychus urticae TaxID=32264 RepID=T1KAP0_TETUR
MSQKEIPQSFNCKKTHLPSHHDQPSKPHSLSLIIPNNLFDSLSPKDDQEKVFLANWKIKVPSFSHLHPNHLHNLTKSYYSLSNNNTRLIKPFDNLKTRR